MARRKRHAPLAVYLNSRLVGQLRKAASGAVDFQYDDSWLSWEDAFPISLSLPLREDRYIGAPVIAVFDNLLPDNPDIRRKLAERARADGTDAFNLLSAIGRDCVGALQFLPEDIAPGPPGGIDARPVSDDEIAALLGDLGNSPLGIGADEEFRISLAGAQEKTALLHWKDQWHIPHGTTATTHIFKPEIGKRPDGIDLSLSVENEHLCMTLMNALGLPAAETAIARFGNRKVLVVKRFDRLWTTDKRLLRLPQEDCCQALSVPPARKYESDGGPGLAGLIGLFTSSDTPLEDQRRIMKAAIVFWLLAATDGHAKNFSLFLYPRSRFSLTPFYDVMSVQPLYDAKQLQQRQMKMAMAIGKSRHYLVHRISPRHFLETAEACGMGKNIVQELFAELLDRSDKAIDKTLAALPNGFPHGLTESIIGGYRRRLRQLEAIIT
ncbi:type II toxin-antitoxin system HipA family toxin [Luteithermobacter gelatinilyticus]|uniref:type II toxin-antitoxin system HipA family toxin n=1 Tax=Luteithermobacter gelatinilyticus TaxID=2582913 RepID=UPI0011067EC7|nr:type II toxin-antitoxin system HipA family toxin [Luteithermobacter gelatinilyticus]